MFGPNGRMFGATTHRPGTRLPSRRGQRFLRTDRAQRSNSRSCLECTGQQVAGKGPAQNGLTQALGAFEVGFDLGFCFADEGEVAVDFGDNLVLFTHWWKGHRHRSEYWHC